MRCLLRELAVEQTVLSVGDARMLRGRAWLEMRRTEERVGETGERVVGGARGGCEIAE